MAAGGLSAAAAVTEPFSWQQLQQTGPRLPVPTVAAG